MYIIKKGTSAEKIYTDQRLQFASISDALENEGFDFLFTANVFYKSKKRIMSIFEKDGKTYIITDYSHYNALVYYVDVTQIV